MNEERRLMAIGIPYSDAVTLCHTMRRGREDLEKVVRELEVERRGVQL